MVRYGEVVVWWLWAAPGSCTRPPCSRWSPAQQQGENCGQGAASSPHSSLTSHGGGAQHHHQPDRCPAPGPAQRGEARRPDNHQLCQSSSLDQKVAAGLGWACGLGGAAPGTSHGHVATSPPHHLTTSLYRWCLVQDVRIYPVSSEEVCQWAAHCVL